VREPNPKVIPVRSNEHLSLVAQPPEGDRMDDPVTVALKGVSRPSTSGRSFLVATAS
jgi:hypothetical protein